MEKSAVAIKIFNDTYNLKTEMPPAEVMEIAQMVDQRMHKLADGKKNLGTDKIAIWTALDLAGELYVLQKKYNKLLQAVKEV